MPYHENALLACHAERQRSISAHHEKPSPTCQASLALSLTGEGVFVPPCMRRTSDEDFPGGGYVFGPTGACLLSTEDWSEGVLYAEIPLA